MFGTSLITDSSASKNLISILLYPALVIWCYIIWDCSEFDLVEPNGFVLKYSKYFK